MPLYTDESLILELAYVVAITPCEGEGQFDGKYWLHLVLDIGGKARELHPDYATREQRDAAFAALRARLADAAVGEEVL